jgi:hypothetical protein
MVIPQTGSMTSSLEFVGTVIIEWVSRVVEPEQALARYVSNHVMMLAQLQHTTLGT